MSAPVPAQLQASKPQRVLACVRCQQRKVKCDRRHPCETCVKAQVHCIPASQLARRRKRRFPERELLDRIRRYEELLRKHKINFEPLHEATSGDKDSPSFKEGSDSDVEQPTSGATDQRSPSSVNGSEVKDKPINMWSVMNRQFRDRDNESESSFEDVRQRLTDTAWQRLIENDESLLFGSRTTNVNISSLHPGPAQVLRLWQIYLDNVDPLLKITHNLSLQGRIIEAAGNIFNISPTLEALIFSIYCMALLTLTQEQCQTAFDSSKEDLMKRFQFGCQHALSNCGFLRSTDRESLTALYLYLLSVRPNTVPKSLSTMLAVAVRIAQRMGIHSEAVLARCSPLEAELRRRLWWSLAIFDTRMGELSDLKAVTLNPSWDCKIPLNVNDSELRQEMKESPQPHGKCSEALFAVVRSRLGDFLRSASFHLGFSTLALKAAPKDDKEDSLNTCSELASIEREIENKYLRFCDPENPLHFMTIWTARIIMAKFGLVDHFFRYDSLTAQQQEVQSANAFNYALKMIEGDTKIMASPLTKGFRWQTYFYFPFPAYLQIARSLKRRGIGQEADLAWETLSDNYEARSYLETERHSPIFDFFAKIILESWDVREAALKQSGQPILTPRIILAVRRQTQSQLSDAPDYNNAKAGGAQTDMFGMAMPMDPNTQSMFYGMTSMMGGDQNSYLPVGRQLESYPGALEVEPPMFDVGQTDWSKLDWSFVNAPQI